MRHLTRGFTLVEILVALGIIVAMLGALGALVRLSALQDTARMEELALTIATSELESLRAGGYDSLPASGSFSHTSLALLPNGAATRTVESSEPGGSLLVTISVTVTWTGPGGSAKEVTLSTMMTNVGGLL